jgi:hypothetical protein
VASAADSDVVSLASVEGDLREGLDPYVVSKSILNAMIGAQLVADTSLALFGSFLPASPYATTRSPTRPTEPTDRTSGGQPTAAPSNCQM